ncbi:MAG TPA: DNA repair protein RadA [Pseudobdellovibrionaceae bacterium]|nr:DNA repair protein RadA [Pseudobdellovibrionaceae bacterium]
MAKSKSKSVFVCQNCGSQRTRWEGRCTDCGEWNTLVEERITDGEPRGLSGAKSGSFSGGASGSRAWAIGANSGSASALSFSIEEAIAQAHSGSTESKMRLPTGSSELDRVLGGGLVKGSFVLVGGDPGIGKSTLMMQMAGGLAQRGSQVLYISGEESVTQTALRAERMGVVQAGVRLAAESELEVIRDRAMAHQAQADGAPCVLIVDSIQTIYRSDIESAPGSVTQVRECAAALMHLAKSQGISVFVIGHVTKEGQIAGPKVLEHMVDTVLAFEGDATHAFRLLRALKNRFGATHELGVFTMDSRGLVEVTNPSEMFLEERGRELIGSAVFASMEGSRPILCEVQALTISSPLPQPRRTSIGFDTQRVHLLAAILNRHLGLKLHASDLFINVVGGLNLDEPAADFAVAAALISSECGESLDAKTVYFGELGLTGEARAVNFADQRLREARKLGFERFIVPASNQKQLASMIKAEKISGVRFVRDLRELAETVRGGRAASAARRPSPRPPKAADDEIGF